jgi:hydroxyethylthiazole kinase-like uncharacterized protein yjeF
MTTNWITRATELLTVAQMYEADRLAVERGVASLDLMERAGAAVADALCARWPEGRVAVLCGPGNNGGDGFVAARLLAARGREVTLVLLGERSGLRGDAAVNADRWDGAVEQLSPDCVDGADVVVDALFGAGLGRPVEGVAAAVLKTIGERDCGVLAVDMPSGLHGDTGEVMGMAARADISVTFFRRKPGQLIYPGRGMCGEVLLADIGTPNSVLGDIAPAQWLNAPDLWSAAFPDHAPDAHKYERGHAVVAGGGELTGAARLASYAALRCGAGLVTIASPPDALTVYRHGRPSVMARPAPDAQAFGALVADPRVRAVLVGPGNGVSEDTRERVRTALGGPRACVLDADALTSFEDTPDALFSILGSHGGDAVLTPHGGEFARLFAGIDDGGQGRLARTRAAAETAGAVVVLKGADTVIAAPDGRAVINDNAPPELATAGSGDVLAGIILGLLAQGMTGFDAACAGVWLHGAAATEFGPGLIADDIADCLPAALRGLAAMRMRSET